MIIIYNTIKILILFNPLLPYNPKRVETFLEL